VLSPKPLRPEKNTGKPTGFTLIELAIAVSISAVLATIAFASYHHFVLKVRRTDAVQALTLVMHAQERYRLQHAVYSDSLSNLTLPQQLSQYYSLSLSPDANGKFLRGYTVAAHARPDGPQVHDGQCLVMSIVVNGTMHARQGSQPGCWPS